MRKIKKILIFISLLFVFSSTPILVYGADTDLTPPTIEEAIANFNSDKYTQADMDVINAGVANGTIVKNSDGTYSKKTGQKAGNGVWTLYPQLLMENPETQESAEESAKDGKTILHPIANALGNKGVSVDIPYTYISQYGNELSKEDGAGNGSNGRLLASFLSTFSNYNYIQTVSGNSIASGASGFLGGIGRFIGMLVGGLGLTIQSVGDFILKGVSSFFLNMNIFNLLGYGKAENTNPISQAISNLLSSIGINPAMGLAVINLSFFVATGMLGIKLMKGLSQQGVKSSKLGEAFKGWFVRLFILFAFLPISGTTLANFTKQIQQFNEDTNFNQSVVSRYIVNTRLWAVGSNLSPDGLTGTANFPSAGAKDGYIDNSFAPAQSRDLIGDINKKGYSRKGETNDFKIGLDLLSQWGSNETFNVNTYTGDIASGSEDGEQLPAYANSEELEGKTNVKDLAGYIWSADQSPDDNSKLPNGKSRNSDFKFDARSSIGVQDNDSFSTQSVALLLQTSLDRQGAHFYAYNIAPTGIQGQAKNLSTVKTEWRSTALVGAGVFGQFGSWFAMVVDSIVISVVMLGCAWALVTVNLVESIKRQVKRLGEVLWFGDVGSAGGLVALTVGVTLTGLMALGIPTLLVGLGQTVGQAGLSKIGNGFFLDGIPELVGALITGGIAYLMVFKKTKTGVTFLNSIIGYPVEIALIFDKRAKMILGTRTPLSSTMEYAGDTIRRNRKMNSNDNYKSDIGAKKENQPKTPSANNSNNQGRNLFNTPNGNSNTPPNTRAELSSAELMRQQAEQERERIEQEQQQAEQEQQQAEFVRKQAENQSKKQMEKEDEDKKSNDKESMYRNIQPNEKFQANNPTVKQAVKPNDENNKFKVTADGNKLTDKEDIRKKAEEKALSNKPKMPLTPENVAKFTPDKKVIDKLNPKKVLSNTYSNEEVESLSKAKTPNEFKERLAKTQNGLEETLNTKPARELLANSDFMEDGKINMDKVNKTLADSQKEGATKETKQDAKMIQRAFNTGGNNLYSEMVANNVPTKEEIRNTKPKTTEPNKGIKMVSKLDEIMGRQQNGSIAKTVHTATKTGINAGKKATGRLTDMNQKRTDKSNSKQALESQKRKEFLKQKTSEK